MVEEQPTEQSELTPRQVSLFLQRELIDAKAKCSEFGRKQSEAMEACNPDRVNHYHVMVEHYGKRVVFFSTVIELLALSEMWPEEARRRAQEDPVIWKALRIATNVSEVVEQFRSVVMEMLGVFPDSFHDGDDSWDPCWDSLSSEAQQGVKEVRSKARELLQQTGKGLEDEHSEAGR